MPANPIYNDGSLSYGSAQLTVTPKAGGGSFEAIADPEFVVQYPATRVETTDQYGAPGRAAAIPGWPNGSCNVLLGTSGTIAPGDTFTTDQTGASVWNVTEVTDTFAKASPRMQAITYHQKLN